MYILSKCNERIQFYSIARGIFESHKNLISLSRKIGRKKSHINLFTKIGLKDWCNYQISTTKKSYLKKKKILEWVG